MKQAVVIDANEVREILAEKFQVPVENVINCWIAKAWEISLLQCRSLNSNPQNEKGAANEA